MDMAGLGMLRDMDILFEVVMYQRNVVNQIGEPLDFDGLPADAVDFAGLDEEELAGDIPGDHDECATGDGRILTAIRVKGDGAGMGMFGLLMKKNVLEQLRDLKRNSLFIFLPVAIFACFYFYYQINDVEMSFVKPMKVGVVLEDDSVYSQMLVNDFGSKKTWLTFFSS